MTSEEQQDLIGGIPSTTCGGERQPVALEDRVQDCANRGRSTRWRTSWWVDQEGVWRPCRSVLGVLSLRPRCSCRTRTCWERRTTFRRPSSEEARLGWDREGLAFGGFRSIVCENNVNHSSNNCFHWMLGVMLCRRIPMTTKQYGRGRKER